jgi:hypothetical protein
MTVDPIAAVATVVGIAALVLAVRRQHQPQPPTREQELLQRVSTLERDIASLQRMLVEKQNEIDALNKRLRDIERNAPQEIDITQDAKRRVLLVGIGDQTFLQADLAQLRGVQAKTNIRITRLSPVSMANLARTIDRHRAQGDPIKLLHLAVHSNNAGLLFADGVATGIWLSEHLADIEVAVLAGCNNDQVADLLSVVPAVISVREEEAANEAARLFTGAFWLAIGQGKDPSAAFDFALQRCPPALAEYVELHL